MNANSKKRLSWTLVALGAYIILGATMWPRWWYFFLFKGGILKVWFWGGELRNFINLLIYGQTVLPFLLLATIGILLVMRRQIRLPDIDLVSKWKVMIPIIGSLLVAFFVYNVNPERFKDPTIQSAEIDNSVTIKKFEAPIDFKYIDNNRISSLYLQIGPSNILTKSVVEKSSGASRALRGGNQAVLQGEYSETVDNKIIDEYATKVINQSLQVIYLMNYFDSRNSLKEYETLELSSDELVELETFRTISDKYSISFEKTKFKNVYDRVLKEKLVEQFNQFSKLSDQVLVTGDFRVTLKEDTIRMAHSYFKIDDNTKIEFQVLRIEKNSSNLLSTSITTPEVIKEPLRLTVFGKVISAQIDSTVAIITVEPYAIW